MYYSGIELPPNLSDLLTAGEGHIGDVFKCNVEVDLIFRDPGPEHGGSSPSKMRMGIGILTIESTIDWGFKIPQFIWGLTHFKSVGLVRVLHC